MSEEIKTPMTADEFLEAMQNARNDGDMEIAHGAMDDLLCDQLRALGYGAAIDVFEKTPKWYA